MKKMCQECKKEIKYKPIIWDDYYFCSGICKADYIFRKEASE